jgi:hypothetical protein
MIEKGTKKLSTGDIFFHKKRAPDGALFLLWLSVAEPVFASR